MIRAKEIEWEEVRGSGYQYCNINGVHIFHGESNFARGYFAMTGNYSDWMIPDEVKQWCQDQLNALVKEIAEEG